MEKNSYIIPMLLLILGASSRLSAASFEVLFPVDTGSGEKSVVTSDDGSVILSVHAGGGQHDTYLWRQSQGIVATYSHFDSIYHYGMSGDGQTILTNIYPDPLGLYDASYDGSVTVGGRGNQA